MKLIIFVFVVIIMCFSKWTTFGAENIERRKSESQMQFDQRRRQSLPELWVASSEVIADVEVIGYEVVYPAKSTGGSDKSVILGDLTTVRVMKPLLVRQGVVSNRLDHIYI